MTQPPSDIAQRLASTHQAIAAGLALVDAASAAADKQLEVVDDVDLSQFTYSLTGEALAGLQSQLTNAAAAGHRIIATAARSGSDLTLSWRSEGTTTAVLSGEPGELAAQRDTDAFARAISRDDGVAALSYLGSETLRLEIVIKSPPGGAAWIRTHRLLTDRLKDGRWASTLIRLTPRHDSDRAAMVVVQDAGAAVLCTPGLTFVGPDAASPTNTLPRPRHLTQAYRTRAGYGSRPEIFAPSELIVTTPPDRVFVPLADMLASVGRATAWYWLADTVAVEPDRVIAHFDGVSSLDLEVVPYGAGPPTAEVALTEWATATGEPSRADAVQQAVTFAVRSAADLARAAAPVLRTARSLYELAGRGLIAEALAARRAARDSAVTAARSAATTAREVATKAVERTLALVIAAAVALFANSRKFIDNGTSYAILAALAALAAAALLIAWLVDTHSGHSVLNAFDDDVELYRDTLSDDDIRATKGLAALSKARSDLCRARVTASLVYGGVILVVLVGGAMIICSQQTSSRKSPTPSPSTSRVTLSPSGSSTPTQPRSRGVHPSGAQASPPPTR